MRRAAGPCLSLVRATTAIRCPLLRRLRCMHRNEVSSDGNVIPFLVLTGVDGTGTLATHCAVFLEDAFGEALALLDEWAPVTDPTST